MVEERVIQRRKELKQELDRIVKILIRKYKPEKIILFGSFVKGKVHLWSDLDMAIIKQTKKRFIKRLHEVALLTDPEVGVDFFVYTPEEFIEMSQDSYFIRDEVIKKGVVIYDKNPAL